jgi:hypothetical protein
VPARGDRLPLGDASPASWDHGASARAPPRSCVLPSGPAQEPRSNRDGDGGLLRSLGSSDRSSRERKKKGEITRSWIPGITGSLGRPACHYFRARVVARARLAAGSVSQQSLLGRPISSARHRMGTVCPLARLAIEDRSACTPDGIQLVLVFSYL